MTTFSFQYKCIPHSLFMESRHKHRVIMTEPIVLLKIKQPKKKVYVFNNNTDILINKNLHWQVVHCPTDAELASLPHIRREQITLTKFLGSGAFGEVFEGVARQLNGNTTDTKVAVKVSEIAVYLKMIFFIYFVTVTQIDTSHNY